MTAEPEATKPRQVKFGEKKPAAEGGEWQFREMASRQPDDMQRILLFSLHQVNAKDMWPKVQYRRPSVERRSIAALVQL